MTTKNSGFIRNPIYISYTGLTDYLKCPRSYYLKNIYRDKDGFRLQIISPFLTLGAVVHDSIKWYLQMNGQITWEQFEKKFRNLWLKYSGKKGGFLSKNEEVSFDKRGLKILKNFFDNAKVLSQPMPFLQFPKYFLKQDIILVGNMDFVGLLPDGTLHVVDFKTGSHNEDSALQLYIYAILAEANFRKKVSKASFWYLDRDDDPREIVLDPLDGQLEWLKEKALELKAAIELGEWICHKNPQLCRDCEDYQALLDGKGEFLFTDFKYKKQIYFLENQTLSLKFKELI